MSLVLSTMHDQIVHSMTVNRLGRYRNMPCMINAMLVPGNVGGTCCGQISRQMYIALDELISPMHSDVTRMVMIMEIAIEMATDL